MKGKLKLKSTVFLYFLFLFLFNNSCINAQATILGITPTAPKFKKHVEFSPAFSYAVINNRKEVRSKFKPGINIGLQYATRSWFSWSAEYTYFFKHNSSPGFVNIIAWNAELNGICAFRMATSKLNFRFVFGLCYLNWAGTFVGPSVNDNNTWYAGKKIEQEWLGANLGFGFEYPFGKNIKYFIDCRSRFAMEKFDIISISDTSFIAGVKWYLPADKSAVSSSSNSRKKKNHKGRFRIYKWPNKR